MATSRIWMPVGVFFLLGISALSFLALKAANLASFSTGKTYTVSARFDDIGGLKKKGQVRSAGVFVGQVASIALDKNSFQGLVVMKINEGVRFPVDSSAKILTAGLLGDQYVGIEPGSGDKNLGDNDLINQTQSAVVLENLIGQLIFNKAVDAGSRSAPTPGASNSLRCSMKLEAMRQVSLASTCRPRRHASGSF